MPVLLYWQVLCTCPGPLCTCPPPCPRWVPPAPWPEKEQGQVKFSRQERDQSDDLEWCLRQAAHPQPHRPANIQQNKSGPFYLRPLLKMRGKKNLFYKILTLSLDLWGSFLSQGRSQPFHSLGPSPIGSNQVGRHIPALSPAF